MYCQVSLYVVIYAATLSNGYFFIKKSRKVPSKNYFFQGTGMYWNPLKLITILLRYRPQRSVIGINQRFKNRFHYLHTWEP